MSGDPVRARSALRILCTRLKKAMKVGACSDKRPAARVDHLITPHIIYAGSHCHSDYDPAPMAEAAALISEDLTMEQTVKVVDKLVSTRDPALNFALDESTSFSRQTPTLRLASGSRSTRWFSSAACQDRGVSKRRW